MIVLDQEQSTHRLISFFGIRRKNEADGVLRKGGLSDSFRCSSLIERMCKLIVTHFHDSRTFIYSLSYNLELSQASSWIRDESLPRRAEASGHFVQIRPKTR